jgi:mannose-1-phosphate guanylyltransferase
VIAFQEKPNEATAQSYLLHGGYLWNSGMYLGKIGDFVREFRAHSPEIAQLFDTQDVVEATFMYPNLSETQIDQAISEKTKNISVIPMHILWSDVGTWDRIYSVSNLDSERNTLRGDVVIEDVTNALLWNMDCDRLLVVEGMQDVVVVQTKESTYIAPRSKPSKIKKLLQKIPFEKQ